MAWTNLSTWSGTLQDLGVLNEFVAAINERLAAMGDLPSGEMDDFEAGIRLQGKETITKQNCPMYTVLAWINANCPNFVQCKDDAFNDLEPADLDGSTGATLTMWSASTLWDYVTAGDSSSGPRRYLVHPDDGGTALYGLPDTGDIIGVWMWEDAQKALNALRWVAVDTEYSDDEAGHLANYRYWWSTPPDLTWAAAKTAAEAHLGYDQANAYSGPHLATAGYHNVDPSRWNGQAIHESAYKKYRPTVIASSASDYTRELYWFARAIRATGSSWNYGDNYRSTVFDAMGLSYAVDGTHKLFESSGPVVPANKELVEMEGWVVDEVYTTAAIVDGTGFPPNWVGDPMLLLEEGDGYVRNVNGCQFPNQLDSHQQALEDYAVADGFEYVA